MNKTKITYWLITGFISFMMIMNGVMYLGKNQQVMDSIQQNGIPYSFIQLLGVAKILRAFALLFSRWKTLKEWAYAGFTFTFIGAIWISYSMNQTIIPALIAVFLLATSYRIWKFNFQD